MKPEAELITSNVLVQRRVGAAGGTVDLPGVARVSIPSGALGAEQVVEVEKTTNGASAALFEEFETLFRVGAKGTYQVRIASGSVRPSGDVRIAVALPATIVVPAKQTPQLFVRIVQSDGMEELDNFQLFPATYAAATRELTAILPPAAFRSAGGTARRYEAELVVATTPTGSPSTTRVPLWSTAIGGSGGPASLPYGDPALCKAALIGSPIGGVADPSALIRSGFGIRTDPVTGAALSMHWGTDLAVAVGTPVVAVASGVVERIRTQMDASGAVIGYGLYMIVRHADGSASLYGHLNGTVKRVGDPVTRGVTIAASGNSGKSTGPHLHFEYVPNGEIVQSQGRIDAFPCVQPLTVRGAITVRDNGNLADDAFEVSLDGIVLGRTEIGASNNFALNNLIPGRHVLVVRCIVAPDNLGTLEVSLRSGLTFDDGTTLKSTTMALGASVTYGIRVPTAMQPTLITPPGMETPRSDNVIDERRRLDSLTRGRIP